MIVYLIRNKINNKYYVGQTSQTLDMRWQEHLSSTQAGSPFHIHNAIRKWGPDNFERSVFRYCKNRQEADEAEALAIFLYQSNNRDLGYNITSGGNDHRDDSPPKVKLKQETLDRYSGGK